MRIQLTRNTLVEGTAYSAGDQIEVEDQLGQALIFMKKARAVGAIAVNNVAPDEQTGPTEAAAVAPDEQTGPTEAAAVAPDEQAVQPKAKRKA